MKTRFRPLAFSTAVGVAGVFGVNHLVAEPPPAPPAPPAAAAKADAPPADPIKFTDEVVATRTAVTPKPMSEAVKKGLAYLVKTQQDDGGWAQGGGWRTTVGGGGGRVEGKDVEDPSDVGNSCITLLALIRAGNTPTEGEYKDAVKKGMAYLYAKVEKADKDTLYVTDVRNTQLQSKIGTYIDTFLANLVLAEMKGKAGADERRLAACLEKTMNKIVKHQTAEGQFANNAGWAPVLSVAVANKGIARAQQNGVKVDAQFFARAAEQSRVAVGGVPAGEAVAGLPAATVTTPAAGVVTATPPTSGPVASLPATKVPAVAGVKPADPVAAAAAPRVTRALDSASAMPAPGFAGGGAGGLGGRVPAGDAGVNLYRIAQGASNYQDVVNGLRVDGKKAQEILKDANAPKEKRDEAQRKLGELEKAEGENVAVQKQLAANVNDPAFVAGFGSNGGEEFLSFLNISETLVVKGGKEWEEWDGKMQKGMEKAQDKDGSWAGHHCITGKNFCTAGALLVLMADRTPFPLDTLNKAKTEVRPDAPKGATPTPAVTPPATPAPTPPATTEKK